MTERWLLCPVLPEAGSVVDLEPNQARHAAKVLRLRPGDAVVLCDGHGSLARGCITAVDRGVSVAVESRREVSPLCPELWVAAALPKGERTDQLVDGLSQAGATGLIPLDSRYASVMPRAGKLEKLRHRARESLKQCGRAHALHVSEPQTVAAVLADAAGPGSRCLLAEPNAEPTKLQAWMSQAERITLFIGPEGGFDEAERTAMLDAGALPWTFGPHVMRIETAAVVGCGVLRYLSD